MFKNNSETIFHREGISRIAVAFLILIGVILIAGVGSYIALTLRTQSSTSVTLTAASDTAYSTSRSNIFTSTGTKVVNSSLGLVLVLWLNSTSIFAGQNIGISVSLLNTLDRPNNVTESSDWKFEWTGGAFEYCASKAPLQVAIFQGNFSYANLSNAGEPLEIYAPPSTTMTYLCPTEVDFPWFMFQPNSTNAISNPTLCGYQNGTSSCSYQRNTTFSWSENYTANGYYSINGNENYEFNSFSGVYTVAAVDEWGAISILHFIVS
jgi:hypothetical protein